MSFYRNQQFSGFSSFSGTLVRFSIKIDDFSFTFTKSLCLVLLRPAETSQTIWLYENGFIKAMFTPYRLVKRSVAESLPDRASVNTRNAAFEAVSVPEQYCSAPLLKVERSVSDRFLKLSESSLNTSIGIGK